VDNLGTGWRTDLATGMTTRIRDGLILTGGPITNWARVGDWLVGFEYLGDSEDAHLLVYSASGLTLVETRELPRLAELTPYDRMVLAIAVSPTFRPRTGAHTPENARTTVGVNGNGTCPRVSAATAAPPLGDDFSQGGTMRLIRLAALTGALALSGGLLVPSTHAAAVQPMAAPAPVVTRIVHVDVDGDGRKDEVTVEQNGTNTFVVNVVTAAGADDVKQFTSTIDDDWGIEPWYGAAKLDGRKGYELLLLTAGSDGVLFRVLSWSKGRLVWEKAPKSRIEGAYDWYLADLGWTRFGYRFVTSAAGKRYVRDFELYTSGKYLKGTIVSSVWKSGAWQKVSAKRVKFTKKQAKAYTGISGVKVILQP
jgi:hypothetical protein